MFGRKKYGNLDDDDDVFGSNSNVGAYVAPNLPDALAEEPPPASAAAISATAPTSSSPPQHPHPTANPAQVSKGDSYVALGASSGHDDDDVPVSKARNFFTGLFRRRSVGKEEKLKKEQEKQKREAIKKKKKQDEQDRKMALKLQAGEMKSLRPGDTVQVNDHGVWLPGTVQSKQEDTWGSEIFVVRWASGGEMRTARKKRKDIRPIVRNGAAPAPQTTTHLRAQSLTQTFAQIQIPPGAIPGSVLKAKINDRSVDVQVPAGAVAGTFLRFPIPSSVMQSKPVQDSVTAKIVPLAPGLDVMEITVPATKTAGDRLNVLIPGRTAPVRVTIPPGVSAGQTFQAELAAGLQRPPAPKPTQLTDLTQAQRELLAQMPPDIQAEMLLNPAMLRDMMGPPAAAPAPALTSVPTSVLASSDVPEEKEDQPDETSISMTNPPAPAPYTTPAASDGLVDLFDSLDTKPISATAPVAPPPVAAPTPNFISTAPSTGAPPAYSPDANTTSAAPTSNELLSKLRAAKAMLSEGLISQADFDATKAAILKQMSS